MRRRQLLLSLAMTVSGVSLLLDSSCVKGQDKFSSSANDPVPHAPTASLSGCPPLPEQASEGTVTVYVAKMPEKPGFVCARTVNGIRPSISFTSFLLQKRDGGQFHDFRERLPPTPPGVIIGEEAVHIVLMPGQWLDRQFPSSSPAPSGMYRACFSYTLPQMTEKLETCSEEFTLP